eukprot:GFYU01000629.1.p1 GENE.GFYU01000629.1~~GFYU01000629.1.p1  ORF type:complete len:534 (+),score=162.71 GFYU01000629.1:28-1629(+)
MTNAAPTAPRKTGDTANENERERDTRRSNIVAAKAVSDAVRTSLGPKGMDKMIQTGKGEVIITNDGATLLKQMSVVHPAAKMFVELSSAQDIEAGDGTTSVVVIAGSLLDAAVKLIDKGLHPTQVSEAFQRAAVKAEEILTNELAIPVTLEDREKLILSATTSLNSKVVSQHSKLLAPIAVDSVLKVVNPEIENNVDLRDIKVVTKLGGTVDDTEMIDGLVFAQKASHQAGGPTRVQNAKIGLIQFCLSPPKTDIEQSVIVSDYAQMDRILKEERAYILKLCKQIQKSGCNVLLIQKSVLRDAVTDLSLHYLAKMKVMVVKDVERTDVEFISKTIGCIPCASAEHFTADKLGTAALVEETGTIDGKIVKVTGIEHPHNTVSVLVRASNAMMLDEAHRSLHDALCVVRCLVKKRFLLPGGGVPEVFVARRLSEYAATVQGIESYCFRAFAEALEVVPYTLAENAGLNPIGIVTELRNKHQQGNTTFGINVRKGTVTDIMSENVVQPLLVSVSAINLAAECVRMILKIDDIVFTR